MIDGVFLNYRTLPVIGDRFVVTSNCNMIAAARLYRELRRGNVPNFVAISDLYDFCFGDRQYSLSKRVMGSVVVRTVRYNPRKLLGTSRSNEKPRVIYSFGHMKEFEYGLEWMICTWLRKFLNDIFALKGENVISGPIHMGEELDALVNSDEVAFHQIYESALWQFHMEEPDWRNLVLDLHEPEQKFAKHLVERKKLKSYRRCVTD